MWDALLACLSSSRRPCRRMVVVGHSFSYFAWDVGVRGLWPRPGPKPRRKPAGGPARSASRRLLLSAPRPDGRHRAARAASVPQAAASCGLSESPSWPGGRPRRRRSGAGAAAAPRARHSGPPPAPASSSFFVGGGGFAAQQAAEGRSRCEPRRIDAGLGGGPRGANHRFPLRCPAGASTGAFGVRPAVLFSPAKLRRTHRRTDAPVCRPGRAAGTPRPQERKQLDQQTAARRQQTAARPSMATNKRRHPWRRLERWDVPPKHAPPARRGRRSAGALLPGEDQHTPRRERHCSFLDPPRPGPRKEQPRTSAAMNDRTPRSTRPGRGVEDERPDATMNAPGRRVCQAVVAGDPHRPQDRLLERVAIIHTA